jgi:hypothetical protein
MILGRSNRKDLPKVWSRELWDRIFGATFQRFHLVVEHFDFEAKVSDTTRILGEPGEASVAFVSDDTKPIRDITHRYFGRLAQLDEAHPAFGIGVSLAWETTRQMRGAQEWWHWGSAAIPRLGVYGWISPVQEYDFVSLHITLGTDNPGVDLFEQLFIRSKMLNDAPVQIYGKLETRSDEKARFFGTVSEYTIAQSVR